MKKTYLDRNEVASVCEGMTCTSWPFAGFAPHGIIRKIVEMNEDGGVLGQPNGDKELAWRDKHLQPSVCTILELVSLGQSGWRGVASTRS